MPPKTRRTYGSGSISQRPDGMWIGAFQAGWTANGTRRRIKVSAKTKAECTRKLRDAQRDYNERGAPAEGVSVRATVKSWSEEWLAHTSRELRPMTWKTNAGCVHKWIVPTIGHRRLTALTPGDIRAVQDAQRAAGLKPSSMLRTHAVLASMLKAAVQAQYRIPDAALTAKRPKKNESDRSSLPEADARQLVSAAGGIEDGSRWLVALYQGLRQSEALGLTWAALNLDTDQPTADVSWQLQQLPYRHGCAAPCGSKTAAGCRQKQFRLPDAYEVRHLWKSYHLVRPKTEKGKRIVPLIPPVAAALRDWRDHAPSSPYGLVWPRLDGTPRSVKLDNDQWAKLQAAAGISHDSGRAYGVHELRHSCATMLRKANVDLTTIKAIMGHSSVLSTKDYLHANQDDARRGLDSAALMLG